MAYFDNAATTYPKPDCVYDFMDSFYRSGGAAREAFCRDIIDEYPEAAGSDTAPAGLRVFTGAQLISLFL